jgi:hypothetical protein
MLVASGLSTLANGQATILNAKVTAQCRFFFTRRTARGTIGELACGSVSDRTSFVISSLNVLDQSDVDWMAVI